MHAKAKGLDVRVLHGEPRPCAAKGRGSVVPAAFARIRAHSLRDAPPDPAPPLACLCAAAGRQGRVEAQPPQPGVARPMGCTGSKASKPGAGGSFSTYSRHYKWQADPPVSKEGVEVSHAGASGTGTRAPTPARRRAPCTCSRMPHRCHATALHMPQRAMGRSGPGCHATAQHMP